VTAPAERVKVLVADDQTLFRTVLARMLGTDSRVDVVGQARDGLEAISAAHELNPNVVLMDLEMPRMGGVEATQRLANEAPDVNVLVLSAYADRSMVASAMASGAVGFLDKDVSFDEMVARILAVAPKKGSGRRARSLLSRRELHVLRQVAGGLSNKQIARHLGISEKTVRNHLSRAFNKLGATNRTEAVLSAIRRGLVTA
jgi:DNA-binding NarL/FixJ family response regulator